MLNFQKDRSLVVGKVYVCPYSATRKLVQFLCSCTWNTAVQLAENMYSSTSVLASASKKLEHLEEWKSDNLSCLWWIFVVVFRGRRLSRGYFNVTQNPFAFILLKESSLELNYTHTCADPRDVARSECVTSVKLLSDM